MKNTRVMMEHLKQGLFDEKLMALYLKEGLERQRARYMSTIEKYEEVFGEKEVEVYSAPGRTEIGGNHTDHQNGKVLAASIDLDAIAVAAKRNGVVSIHSEGYAPFELDITDLGIRKEEAGTTAALVRGVLNGCKVRGYEVGGFEAYITSEVLSGSGLSSSAAYEVLMGNIISGLYNDSSIDAVTIAQIGQEAERNYFGKPCGLMDQMACSVGSLVFIDFADTQKPVVKKVEVDFNHFGHCLCIVDTKGSHADLTDEYAAIPEEMRAVAAYFGKEVLAQVDKEEFLANIAAVREKTGDRAVLRAIHWFNENERVETLVKALDSDDFAAFKEGIIASGNSSFKFLQNVFSVKNVQEQAVSLGLALSEQVLDGQGASRVHGGGFAGTIQAFVPVEKAQEYKAFLERVYGVGACYILHIRPEGGLKVLD